MGGLCFRYLGRDWTQVGQVGADENVAQGA